MGPNPEVERYASFVKMGRGASLLLCCGWTQELRRNPTKSHVNNCMGMGYSAVRSTGRSHHHLRKRLPFHLAIVKLESSRYRGESAIHKGPAEEPLHVII